MVLLSVFLLAIPMAAQQADSITVTPQELADKIIEEAKRHLGKPYRWAASGPSVFDCSGFTRYVYRQFGYHIPRTSQRQAADLRPVLGDMSSLQKGDLILFGNYRNNKTIGHVGIFIELIDDGRDFYFIHAAHGGVQISRLSEQYYLERFKGAVRVIPDFIDINPVRAEMQEIEEVVDVKEWAPDTLRLGAGDKRLILFGDGRWAYVEEDGRVAVPTEEERIVLAGDGSWSLLVGTGVKIPSIVENNESSRQAEARGEGVSGPQYYTVKKGDNLGKIAAKYHTTVSNLCKLNHMKSTDVLKIGRKLRVR